MRHFVGVGDQCFHGHGDFIIEDVLLWNNACVVEACDEGQVCPGEFGVCAIFDGFHKDGAGINFDHDHDVVISCLVSVGKFSGLVSEDGVTDFVGLRVDIMDFASSELVGVHFLKWRYFGFGGADVLAGLIEMSLGRLCRVGVILLDVLGC